MWRLWRKRFGGAGFLLLTALLAFPDAGLFAGGCVVDGQLRDGTFGFSRLAVHGAAAAGEDPLLVFGEIKQFLGGALELHREKGKGEEGGCHYLVYFSIHPRICSILATRWEG